MTKDRDTRPTLLVRPLKSDGDLLARVQRVADLYPEFEGQRSSVVRLAVREFVDRKLADLEQERAA